MITSIHTMLYSDDAPATRAFLRDVLGWTFVELTGESAGWMIFNSGPSEMGVHPTVSEWKGQTYTHPRHHEISLMCDDIHKTVEELKAKGAEFRGDVQDQGFGLTINMIVPAAGEIMLYQPRHTTAFNL